MSGTSGRRRTADCGIRWSTAMLGTDHVRTTVSRRAAGAGKRALTEYRRARLALSLGIVVIGGCGGGSGDGITRGDAISTRASPPVTGNESSRARDNARQLASAELSNSRQAELFGSRDYRALQEESSSLKLFVAKLFSSRGSLFNTFFE